MIAELGSNVKIKADLNSRSISQLVFESFHLRLTNYINKITRT